MDDNKAIKRKSAKKSKASSKKKRIKVEIECDKSDNFNILSTLEKPLSQILTEKEKLLEKERMVVARVEKQRQQKRKKLVLKRDNFNKINCNLDAKILAKKLSLDDNVVSTSTLHLIYSSPNSFKKRHYDLLKSRGIKVTLGKFQLWEDAIIRRNYEQFKEDFNLDDDLLLLGFTSWNPSQEVRNFYRKMRKENHYFLRLAKDLPDRPINAIYCRARKLLTPLSKIGSCSKDKKKKIRDLHKDMGNRWTEIARNVLCDPESAKHFILKVPEEKKGHWNLQESKSLVKAMKKVGGKEIFDPLKCKHIPWTQISKEKSLEKFKRIPSQCRKHWVKTLSWKLSNPNSEWKSGWTKLDSAKLVYFLYHATWKTEAEIDWDVMKEIFSYVANYALVRTRWALLKGKVPENDIKSYRLVIEHLWQNRFPKLVSEEEKKAVEEFYKEAKQWF